MLIDDLELPRCLERVDGGIRCAGHRVSLWLIADAMINNVPLDRLEEQYPTVAVRQLKEVIAFCKKNWPVVLEYHRTIKEESDARWANQRSSTPSLEELRRRFQERFGKPYEEIIKKVADGP